MAACASVALTHGARRSRGSGSRAVIAANLAQGGLVHSLGAQLLAHVQQGVEVPSAPVQQLVGNIRVWTQHGVLQLQESAAHAGQIHAARVWPRPSHTHLDRQSLLSAWFSSL